VVKVFPVCGVAFMRWHIFGIANTNCGSIDGVDENAAATKHKRLSSLSAFLKTMQLVLHVFFGEEDAKKVGR
jgi:hypothetical protein